MFYIHQTSCISPQKTFPAPEIDWLRDSRDNKLPAIEPSLDGIPAGLLRRMSKSVRLGVGAAYPFLSSAFQPDGILIGTGNGGMEESVRFLKQIIDYKEETLAPGSFVQSTSNALASQLAIIGNNKGYNITHVHRGLAFENTVTDVDMLLAEHPSAIYLLGAADEISSYNYTLEYLDGWYKKEALSNKDLYSIDSPGSIAGEGAAMFLVNKTEKSALAEMRAIATLHSKDEQAVRNRLRFFLQEYLSVGKTIDLFLTGENGDSRLLPFYASCETVLGEDSTVARFKHMCGEYPTAQAFAVWLACQLAGRRSMPLHMIKRSTVRKEFNNILIYNTYRGIQHSFMLIAVTGGSQGIPYGQEKTL